MHSRTWAVIWTLLLPAAAAAGDPARGRITVSAELREVPLRAALGRTLEVAGFQYVVEPTVPDVPVSLRLREVSAFGALRATVEAAARRAPGLELVRDGPVYVLGLRAVEVGRLLPPSGKGAPEAAWESVSLSFRDAPFGEALEGVLHGSGLKARVDPEDAGIPVSLTLREVPRVTALRLLVRQAAAETPGLTYAWEGSTFRVFPACSGRAPRVPGVSHVSVVLRDVPLREVLRMFKRWGLQYAVEEDVPEIRLTLTIRDMSPMGALRCVFREARRLAPGLRVNS